MKLLGLAFAITAVAACGDNGKQTPPGSDQVQALCDLYQTACEREVECGVYIFSHATDVDACVKALDCQGYAEGAAHNDVAISKADAVACDATIAADSCEQLVPWHDAAQGSILTDDAHCAKIFVGSRAEGDSCSWTQQCGSGLTCSGETCPGTCTAGDGVCHPGTCDAGSFCDGERCEARAALGATCNFSNNENACVDGAFCNFGDDGSATCIPQIAAGGACDLSNFGVCADGNACIDGTCKAPLPTGAACESYTDCGEDGFCSFEEGNVCKPVLALGAACPADGNSCGRLHDCIDGTCQVIGVPSLNDTPPTFQDFVGDGADCTLANCQPGLACLPSGDANSPAWTCSAAPKLGEACSVAGFEFDLLFTGRAASTCSEGSCDIFAPVPTCVQPKAAGEACSTEGTTAECQSLECIGGVCAEPFEDCVAQ